MARPFPYTDHASLFDLAGVRVHRWTLADGTVVTSPDGRMEATIADGAIEVVRVSGDSREVRWRGVYEAKGRKWVVREAPKVSEESHTWVDDTTQIILSSMP